MAGIDLVTGGAGFIGSHLVAGLLGEGRHVRVLDNFASGRRQNLESLRGNSALEIVTGDIADVATVEASMRGVERVFHLAALADIVPSIERPADYYRTNVTGTFNICEAARAVPVRRLIYAASSSCYGIPTTYPTGEDSPIQPRYPYALTKYLGETLVMHWAQVYGLPAISLRLFNVYGPRARTSGTYGAVFGVFIAQLLAGQPLTIVGDGTQTRDFTFVTDVISAFIMAAQSPCSGRIYNVGTGNDISVNQIATLLGATALVHIPKRPGEPDCTRADVSRIRAELGWSARIAIEEGVANLLKDADYWRDAPVWTAESIQDVTRDWFKFLGGAELRQ